MKERKLAVAGAQMLQVEVVPGVEEEEMMMICNLQILKEVVTEAVEEVEVTEVDLVVVIVLQWNASIVIRKVIDQMTALNLGKKEEAAVVTEVPWNATTVKEKDICQIIVLSQNRKEEVVVATEVPWNVTTVKEKDICQTIVLSQDKKEEVVVAVVTEVPWNATTVKEKDIWQKIVQSQDKKEETEVTLVEVEMTEVVVTRGKGEMMMTIVKKITNPPGLKLEIRNGAMNEAVVVAALRATGILMLPKRTIKIHRKDGVLVVELKVRDQVKMKALVIPTKLLLVVDGEMATTIVNPKTMLVVVVVGVQNDK